MKTKIFFSLVALTIIFSACNKDLPDAADSEMGAKAAVTLPVIITPFENVTGATVDAKAFDKFGQLFDPRDEGKPLYIADGIFFVKMKPSNEKNAKMANILVFEGNPTSGILTVQTKINGNKCFSYVFNTETLANKAFWVDNGTSVRYVFVPEGTPKPTASISGTVEGVGEGITVELHKASSLKASIPGYDRVASTTTTAGGYYCFNNLEQGTYIVVVIFEGKEYISQPVTVNNGQAIGNVNITPELPPVTGEKQMSMITKILSGRVSFIIAGTGTATIDWGDGFEETIPDLTGTGSYECSHTYLGSSSRTITITGENITYLNCTSWNFMPSYSTDIFITSLDVSKNSALEVLYCHHNQLTSIDLSKNVALTFLDCRWNPLKSFDVSKNTALIELWCTYTEIKSLDLSKNIALTKLFCGTNELTSLDVSKNIALTDFECDDNQLTSLDISNNTALEWFDCSGNQISNLLISNSNAPETFKCFSNNLSATSLNTIFEMLPNKTGWLLISGNPGTSSCNASIAINKGWTIYF